MATIPVFVTFSAGSILAASQLNNFSTAGNFFLSWPVCEARQTVAQSIATSTSVAITLDTNDIDTDGGHSTVTNTSRYTGKTQGRFQFSGSLGYAASGTGRRLAAWFKNGTAVNSGQVALQTTVANDCQVPAKTLTVFLNGTTDYLELNAWQESGGALNTFVGGGGQSGMSVRMVGTT